MMSIDYKVNSGKLIRLDAKFDSFLISEIKISGDFFIYPNHAIKDIESFLIGKDIRVIDKLLKDFLKDNDYQVIGFNSSDLQKALLKLFNINQN